MLWMPRKRAGDGCWTEAASDKFQALLPDCLVASLPSPAAPITSKASSVSDKSIDHPKDLPVEKVRSKPRTRVRWRDDVGPISEMLVRESFLVPDCAGIPSRGAQRCQRRLGAS